MKTCWIVVSLISVLLSGSGWLTANAQAYIDQIGGFSYVTPEGWTPEITANSALAVIFGPRSEGYTPNVTFMLDKNDADLETFVATTLSQIQTDYANYQITILTQEGMTTDVGLTGIRVTLDIILPPEKGSATIHELMYVFDLAGVKKLTALCNRLATQPAEYEGVFEAIMQSLAVEE
jgi:hypothetical protein